jgi:hypothetical protein
MSTNVSRFLFGILTIWLGAASQAQAVRVGSKNFTEQFIVAEIYAQALQSAGITAQTRTESGCNADRARGPTERRYRSLSGIYRHGNGARGQRRFVGVRRANLPDGEELLRKEFASHSLGAHAYRQQLRHRRAP